MNNYDRDISIIIEGRSYYLSGYSSSEKDGSRKVFMRLNHNYLCQIMQQDGDDETCTCYPDYPEADDPVSDLANKSLADSTDVTNPPQTPPTESKVNKRGDR